MNEFHFLRPWWLLSIIPVLLIAYRLYRYKQGRKVWQGIVDEQLKPYVLQVDSGTRTLWPIMLLLICGFLSILVLSGPVWEKLPVPLYKAGQKVVLVLDLSRSMDATDVKPSRLKRAKHKLGDIFKLIPDAQFGLVVFSEVPYTISPITDDVDTILALLPAVSTDVLPVQGGRIALALDHAGELLVRAKAKQGRVILLTDSEVGPESFAAAERLRENDYPLSVLAIGTEQGGPVRLSDGSLLKDKMDNIIIAQLDRTGLRDLAISGGGYFSGLDSGDDDIGRLIQWSPNDIAETVSDPQEKISDIWLERAPWLLPLILLCLAGLFRRGVL